MKKIKRMPIILSGQRPEQKIYNVMEPAKKVYFGTDNLNTKVFRKMRDMTETAMTKVLIEGKPSKIIESESQLLNGTPKKVESTTKFWFEVVEGCNIAKLTPTDQCVLGACMAEWEQGNKIVTADMIFRDCGGVGSPAPDKVQEILTSVSKMIGLKICIDATETVDKLHQMKRKYSDTFKKVVGDVLLPASYQYTTLNGHPNTLTVEIRDVSLIIKYAMAKGQIKVIPTELLVVPHKKNTIDFLELKGYINLRIQAIKRTRKKNNKFPTTITIEKLIKNCGFKSKIRDRKFRKRLWDNLMTYMEFLIGKKVITKYTLLGADGNPTQKLDENGKIIFTYDSSKFIDKSIDF